jgi:uncharacterized protein
MSLKEVLQADWKAALKARDKFTANVITGAKAAILQVEKSGAGEINDEIAMEIMAKEVKQRRDAIEEFKKGNRQDLIDNAEKEIEILLEYLPKQLNEDEIFEIVKNAADQSGANSMKDLGKLMGIVISKTKGRADGKLVNRIVKQYLN